MQLKTLIARVEELKDIKIDARSPLAVSIEQDDLIFLFVLIELEIEYLIEIPDEYLADLSITWEAFAKNLSRLEKIPETRRDQFIEMKEEMLCTIMEAVKVERGGDERVATLQQELETALQQGDPVQICGLYNRLGGTFYEQGDSEKALACYLESHSLLEDLEDPLLLMAAKSYIGMILRELGELDEALEFCFSSLDIAMDLSEITPDNSLSFQETESLKTYGKSFIGEGLRNMSHIYILQGKYQEAMDGYERLLDLAKDINDQLWVSEAVLLMTHVQFKLDGEVNADLDAEIYSLLRFFQEAQHNDQMKQEAAELLEQCLASFNGNSDFPSSYAIGQWVRFTQDYVIEKNQFIVEGMLGVVEPDPYSLCPPGQGEMVSVLGTKITYGFHIEFLEPIPEPNADQKAQAIKDASRAWEIIQEKGSWVGYPFRNLDALTVLKELQVHLKKLPVANDPEYLLGVMKRIRKVLHAFSPSPWGKEALELSKRCEPHIKPEPPPKELLEDIRTWVANVYSELPSKQVVEKVIHMKQVD